MIKFNIYINRDNTCQSDDKRKSVWTESVRLSPLSGTTCALYCVVVAFTQLKLQQKNKSAKKENRKKKSHNIDGKDFVHSSQWEKKTKVKQKNHENKY